MIHLPKFKEFRKEINENVTSVFTHWERVINQLFFVCRQTWDDLVGNYISNKMRGRHNPRAIIFAPPKLDKDAHHWTGSTSVPVTSGGGWWLGAGNPGRWATPPQCVGRCADPRKRARSDPRRDSYGQLWALRDSQPGPGRASPGSAHGMSMKKEK